MPSVATKIRHWLGANAGETPAFEQDAARNQLQDHIDADLLESFLQRTINEEQHQTVINHLNQCDVCREAIAVVLLAVDDPKAAVELELERKRRHEKEPEVWWKQAVRWSILVILALGVITLAVLIPKSKDPESAAGRWFAEKESSSSTSFGRVFSSRYEEAKPEPRRRASSGAPRQFGWDTGPARYVGNVEPSTLHKEVDISSDRGTPGAEDAPGLGAGQAAAPVQSAAKSGAKSAAQPARRRLVVSPEGELNRTLDGGASWQHVIVGPGLVFRSLALSGRTVWASGDAGALYRSADAAEHWQQVQIHYRGEPIKDDLVAIQFSDPQHGVIRGANGHEWITVDGGNKWVLNPTTETQ